MYKTTHENRQRRADGYTIKNLQTNDEELKEHDQLQILLRQAQLLQEEVKRLPKGSRERKRVGLNIAKINLEINQLKNKAGKNFLYIFHELCRSILAREQYDALEEHARFIAKQRHGPEKERAAIRQVQALEKSLEELEKLG